jgi:hypothetical protein
MVQNRGGVHDVWARAEIERRHMQALHDATEQVHRHGVFDFHHSMCQISLPVL